MARVCTVDGCDEQHFCKDRCRTHYQQYRHTLMPACTVDGCDKSQHSRGLCATHYGRLRKYGDVLADTPTDVRVLPKCCESCGETYVPASMRQRWCKTCAPTEADARRISLYGITATEYADMGVVYAICGAPTDVVDHDHATSEVRGRLCTKCNVALPHVEDEEWRESALRYLRKEVVQVG